jgi:hypothetical protein
VARCVVRRVPQKPLVLIRAGAHRGVGREAAAVLRVRAGVVRRRPGGPLRQRGCAGRSGGVLRVQRGAERARCEALAAAPPPPARRRRRRTAAALHQPGLRGARALCVSKNPFGNVSCVVRCPRPQQSVATPTGRTKQPCFRFQGGGFPKPHFESGLSLSLAFTQQRGRSARGRSPV